MRWLALYLRSRQVAYGAAVALACVVGITALSGDSSSVHSVMAMLAVTVVASVTAIGLAGPDPALERTAALDWRGRRATHAVALAALAFVLTKAVGPEQEMRVVMRNAIGLTGLAALGVTVLGSALAWCLPMAWTVVSGSALMASHPPPAPFLTWPLQPANDTPAMVTACVVGTAGLLVYAMCGPRLSSAARTTWAARRTCS